MEKKKRKTGPTRSKLIHQLDQIFSVYVRLLVADKDGNVTCPLCGAVKHWKEAQNMHFISRSVYKYRRDEKNCHAGCMRCNVILHGNYIVYTRWMQRRYGEELVDQMINDKQIVKIGMAQIGEMINTYKGLVSELMATKGL